MQQTMEERRWKFQESFKPEEFHRLYQAELPFMGDIYFSSLATLHQMMTKGKFKGNKLLDIGSGPTVHNVASASACFNEIVLSDFVEANCEELRKWLKGQSDLDWSPFLETVAKLEGYQDLVSGRQEIEARIRSSVRSVVHCDVLSDQVIPPELTTEYDVIVTSLTLECAAPDFESFVTILKRLNNLLCTGGGLVMMGFLNSGEWKTAGGEFPYLRMTQSDIDKALDTAGFKEKDWKTFPVAEDILHHHKDERYYIVAAVKRCENSDYQQTGETTNSS